MTTPERSPRLIPPDDAATPETTLYRRSTPGRWLACEYPERRPEPGIDFHLIPCRGCATVATVLLNEVNPLTHPNITARLHKILDDVDPPDSCPT